MRARRIDGTNHKNRFFARQAQFRSFAREQFQLKVTQPHGLLLAEMIATWSRKHLRVLV